ncbi:hypothetical protein MASR2M36_05310 [Providencia sp.]
MEFFSDSNKVPKMPKFYAHNSFDIFNILFCIINILDKKIKNFYSLIKIKRVGMTRNMYGSLIR